MMRYSCNLRPIFGPFVVWLVVLGLACPAGAATVAPDKPSGAQADVKKSPSMSPATPLRRPSRHP